MAFDINNLGTGLTGFTSISPFLWDYTTSDTMADVEALKPSSSTSAYFAAPYHRVFRPNDLIAVTASDGKGLFLVQVWSPASLGGIILVKIASVNSF